MKAATKIKTDGLIALIREIYSDDKILLHRPVFEGNERQYLLQCIESNYVSSVGARVKKFEKQCADFTNNSFGIASVNGTAALHIALLVAGVGQGDEVISQALTFVATCNAISYCGAKPVFVDVDQDTMGLSPQALERWLSENVEMRDGRAHNCNTGARLSACVPMHTFGLPMRIAQTVEICDTYGIPVIEDAAESLGSMVDKRHTGSFGKLATLSFNGNKIITTGGGGMILTNNEALANRALHLTTTAKVAHAFEYVHDEIGYNYRLPNLNAALGCAQMEKLPEMLQVKAEIASRYREFCAANGLLFADALEGTRPNYWLNAIVLENCEQRDDFLKYTNANGIMTRPIWRLMSSLSMFKDSQNDGLENAQWLEKRVVNIPSSVPEGAIERL